MVHALVTQRALSVAVGAGKIAAISVMVVLVVGAGGAMLGWYRKRKFETELMAASWKVAYADVMFTRDIRVRNKCVYVCVCVCAFVSLLWKCSWIENIARF